jgi:phosphoribosylformylglycinamidine synthase subunit PurQ / glutaminase
MSCDFGVVVFPGSNCDRDCYNAIDRVFKKSVKFIWHEEKFSPKDYKCIMLPGGFSYGDYLRSGAMARYSKAMDSVVEFAEKGGLVFGSCNGFQILLEAGLLPGAMMRNRGLKFICDQIYLRTERTDTPFTNCLEKGKVIKLPIAHADGSYYIDEQGLKELEENRQVVLRYCSSSGDVSDSVNPNGSLNNIAGIVNKKGNVFGLMPHPERCSEKILGNTDGAYVFNSILKHLA